MHSIGILLFLIWPTPAQFAQDSDDPRKERGGYLIITADLIARESQANGLAAFIHHKRRLGFAVVLDTTQSIYARYDKGAPQEKIQRAIRDQHRRGPLRYLLLVGNPDANAEGAKARVKDPGVVPMMRCQAMGTGSMTDMYYSDLDEDWNPDGNAKTGEKWDHVGRPDISVGRIAPVGGYVDDVVTQKGKPFMKITRTAKLRRVFEKLIRYDRQRDKSWRFRLLVAGSYMYGSKKGNTATTLTETAHNVMVVDKKFSADLLFQDGKKFGRKTDLWFDGVRADDNTEATALLRGSKGARRSGSTMYEYWCRNGYGFVIWRGHGSWMGTSVGKGDTKDGLLISQRWVLRGKGKRFLDNDRPSIVLCASCNNGSTGKGAYGKGKLDLQRAKWGSLAQAMHFNGAIAVIAASHATTGQPSCPKKPRLGQSAWYQRNFMVRVAKGDAFGDAFRNGKQIVHKKRGGGKGRIADWFRINFFGDPSQRLFEPLSSFPDDRFDQGKGNDTMQTAAPLTITRGSWGAVRAVSKDEDWYTLGAVSGALVVRLKRAKALGSVVIEVYDSSKKLIAGAAVENEGRIEWRSKGSLKIPRAYVRVVAGPFVVDYDLSVRLN